MIKVSATKLRTNLFDFLDKVSEGETVIIQLNKKEVARLISTKQSNWRKKMNIQPTLLVDSDDIIDPIEEIWKDYV